MSKTILITGASNGFGKDAAKTLAAAGHRVFATMRDMQAGEHDAARDFRSAGIETIDLDVTDDASVEAAFREVAHKTGGTLDVLVNNAGMAFGGLSETFTPDQVRAMFEVNVFGLQRMLRSALPLMRNKGSGLVINVGSILGRLTIPFFGIYCASKHAVEALTDSYRYELSQLGIDVVLVQPGPYPTNLYANMQQGADAGRADAYAEIAALPGRINDVLGSIFGSATAPDPHDVPLAIQRLIETPPGGRPDRVVVGLAFGADAADEALRPLQAQMIAGFDFQQLETLRIA
ncbi:oxidoreductase [Nostoc sp. 3335mG]|nr:oxidoreductase [Nostoc sp. 3335mG]